MENIKQLEIYDLVALRETWWDESQNWSTASEGHKLFRRMGWEGGAELLLFMLKNGNTEELPLGNSCEQVKGLWVKMKARTKEGQFSAGVCYGCPTRESLLMRLLASDTANITLISSHPDGGF